MSGYACGHLSNILFIYTKGCLLTWSYLFISVSTCNNSRTAVGIFEKNLMLGSNKIHRHITVLVHLSCICLILEIWIKCTNTYQISSNCRCLSRLRFYMTVISLLVTCWGFSMKCTLLTLTSISTHITVLISKLMLYIGWAHKKYPLWKWYRK